MQEEQVKLVTARLRELGEQGKLTAMDVGSITSSFETILYHYNSIIKHYKAILVG